MLLIHQQGVIIIKIVFAQASSGGHLYPSISFNNFLDSKYNTLSYYFITGKEEETHILKQSNKKYYTFNIKGLSKNIFSNFKSMYHNYLGYKNIKSKLKQLKPDLVIGTGGNISGITIYAAKKLKIPTLIHEQNYELGKANKLSLKHTDILLLSVPINIQSNTKQQLIGNPRSYELYLKYQSTYKNTNPIKDTILIISGSQGSETINNYIVNNLDKLPTNKYKITLVTGPKHYNKYKSLTHKNLSILPYTDNILELYSNTLICISRAGATTYQELLSLKIPTIFIPSPYVPNNHQYKNLISNISNNTYKVLKEDNITTLPYELNNMIYNYSKYKEALDKNTIINTKDLFLEVVNETVHR